MLIILLFVVMVLPSYAEEKGIDDQYLVIEPRFTNIYTFHTYFDIDGNGKAKLVSSLDGHSGDNSRIEATLQRYSRGRWENVKNFSSSSNSENCSISKEYYVSKGYSYRMIFNGKVFNGSTLLDSTTQTSSLRFY